MSIQFNLLKTLTVVTVGATCYTLVLSSHAKAAVFVEPNDQEVGFTLDTATSVIRTTGPIGDRRVGIIQGGLG